MCLLSLIWTMEWCFENAHAVASQNPSTEYRLGASGHGKRGLRGYGTRVTVVGRTNGNVEGCV